MDDQPTIPASVSMEGLTALTTKEANALMDQQAARIEKLEIALAGIIDHWREFGGMMVYNNSENRDDYGLDERIERVAPLVGR